MTTTEKICTECGRTMVIAKRVYKGGRYCPTCYKRWFIIKSCVLCGATTRAHKHDKAPKCATCQRIDRTCIRCHRLVSVAGLMVDGKPVCPSCVPHFKEPKICPECGRHSLFLARDAAAGYTEPVCEHCRREHYKTCSVCHKHRPTYQFDENGRPICKRCATVDRQPHSCPDCGTVTVGPPHALCENCQIRNRLVKRFRLHLERLESNAGKKLFTDFFKWFSERYLEPKSCGRLDRYAVFFERVDREVFLREGKKLSADNLAIVFTAEQLRKATTPLCFLGETLGVHLDTELVEKLTEERRINNILSKAKEGSYGPLLERFHETLLNREPCPRAHSIRIYLRTALTFLEDSQVGTINQLSQSMADKILNRKPGLRTSAGVFFSFLRSQYRMDLDSIKSKKTSALIAETKLNNILHFVLVRLKDRTCDIKERRSLVAFALSKLYGLPLKKVLLLQKNNLISGVPIKLKLDGEIIPMDDKLIKMLNIQPAEFGKSEDYIFEGRIRGYPLSVDAVRYWVLKNKSS